MSSPKRPTIFISHAHEDKAAFANDLAQALKEDFEVWYDDHVLVVGQSLPEQIDKGLASCDFGVVILSKAFFDARKNWPRNELDALLAIETRTRKLILPIWHGITKDELAQYSPLLAPRFAGNSKNGVAAVVSQIKAAVAASSRTHEIEAQDSGEKALNELVSGLNAKAYHNQTAQSTNGVALAYKSVGEIVDKIIKQFELLSSPPNAKFAFRKGVDGSLLTVHGPNWVSVRLDLIDIYNNSANNAQLRCGIFRKVDPVNSRRNEIVQETSWKPRFLEGDKIGWVDDSKKLLSAATLAGIIIEDYCMQIKHADPDESSGGVGFAFA